MERFGCMTAASGGAIHWQILGLWRVFTRDVHDTRTVKPPIFNIFPCKPTQSCHLLTKTSQKANRDKAIYYE